MKQSHSPGPWNIETCRAPDGIGFACSIGTPDGPEIAVVVPSDTMDEDAALICAAPDLLSALEHVIEWARNVAPRGHEENVEYYTQLAQAAIARARGNSPTIAGATDIEANRKST